MENLTPRQIVKELDKYIIGQDKAKRSVAVAIRNRIRRQKLPPELQEEVAPKNILMIGPTGVGKTEIARRLAKLVDAPFIKVEATKYTEVGYVGRDVESMVRELVETAVRMVKAAKTAEVADQARKLAEQRLLDILAPLPKRSRPPQNPLESLLAFSQSRYEETPEEFEEKLRRARAERRLVQRKLAAGELEDMLVEVEVEDTSLPTVEVFTGAGVEELGINFQELLGGLLPKRKKKRRLPVSEARRVLEQEEAQKLIDMDAVIAEAIRRTEQSGIIFIDELDKIAGRERGVGPDVSREGVQRDILPIVEGCTVATKYGPVKTDHILFIAAGAFHTTKPSDLIPELQGRFPIRVELEPLGREHFRRILVEPENALVKQYTALLATEGITLRFTDDALDEIAEMACRVNEQTENIGARRLHTIMERLLEEISFEAPEIGQREVVVDGDYVRQKLADVVQDSDLSRYIL